MLPGVSNPRRFTDGVRFLERASAPHQKRWVKVTASVLFVICILLPILGFLASFISWILSLLGEVFRG